MQRTHRDSLLAPEAYHRFSSKQDDCIKTVLDPWAAPREREPIPQEEAPELRHDSVQVQA